MTIMIHPLLHLVATQPHLLAEHAQAYAELVAAEIGAVSTRWRRRALLGMVGLCCLVAAMALAGMAWMLWAVVPIAQMPAPWVLIVAPLVPVIVAAGCLLAARGGDDDGTFDSLRHQLKDDMAMLREVSVL
ncbi:hypothetical protein [Rhodoferax sediminis]|uniref:Phage holin family protein n=1 Tax=Rhodoferax sediminis TaxID=2509614 RepID=A0A515D8N1_9BURK|nr:hypothetical protein [Rhodoferax sediminis]QDL36768.1 hypothetical protein EUB48_05240 [Rhodoferax sediminis]